MGSAASAARQELNKPQDASDLTSLGSAKEEVVRLRALIHRHQSVGGRRNTDHDPKRSFTQADLSWVPPASLVARLHAEVCVCVCLCVRCVCVCVFVCDRSRLHAWLSSFCACFLLLPALSHIVTLLIDLHNASVAPMVNLSTLKHYENDGILLQLKLAANRM